MWLLYSTVVAIVTNVVLAVFLFFFISNGIQLVDELFVSDNDAIDSEFM